VAQGDKDEAPSPLRRANVVEDEKCASLVEAAQAASPVPGGANEAALGVALARRLLLAARLALLHRVSRAAQANLLAESETAAALSAAASAATAAAQAEACDAAGIGLGTTVKYLRCLASGAAGTGLCTTAKGLF
jgi:hypothetical protein